MNKRSCTRVQKFDDLIGVPFVDRGRDPRIGLDCWGLFMEAMKRFGHDVPDYPISCFAVSNISNAAAKEIMRNWKPIPGPIPGAGVTMALHPEMPNVTQHFGVCLDERRVIHTLQDTGVKIDFLDRVTAGALLITGFYAWKPKNAAQQ